MLKRNYTKEQIEKAVRNSFNYSQVFRNLSILINGGSYRWIKSIIHKYNISTDHFCQENISLKEAGIAATRRRWKNKFDKEDISTEDRIAAKTLRNYLIHNNIASVCNTCNLTEWLGKPLRLDVDHIDGNPINNRLDNLQFICPNCHRSKTIECNDDGEFIGAHKTKKASKVNFCKTCSVRINNYAKQCKKCEMLSRRLTPENDRFDKGYVIDLLSNNSMLRASKILGISDNGLRKYCKRNNIDYKAISQLKKCKDC